MKKNKEFIEKLTEEIKKYEDKTFKVLFYVLDTKGMPSGSLTYIYETAYALKEMGYNVQMLHSEKEFIGVGEWLGEKYADLPHYNIESGKVSISPADILFIPEIFTSLMFQTMELPCKRVALMQNFGYLTEMIQPGVTWSKYGIYECVTTSESLSDRVKEMFPSLRTYIVRPSISDIFKKPTEPQKLIVNFVTKNKTDLNSIVKPFMCKYPKLQWVCLREISGLPKEEFAEALRESIATVWVDDKTDFGYAPLEAMACGNVVIGKIPENIPEWMLNSNGGIRDNGLWFDRNRQAVDMLEAVIDTYLNNEMPDIVEKNSDDTLTNYTPEKQIEDIKKVYVDGLFASREREMREALQIAKNKEKENDD